MMETSFKEEMQETSVSFTPPADADAANLAQMLINANKSKVVKCFKVHIRCFLWRNWESSRFIFFYVVCFDL